MKSPFSRFFGRRFLALMAAVMLFAVTGIFTAIQPASAATVTWDNGALDGLWSSCANWSSDACPGASDVATFNPATSDTSATIDAGFAGSVAGVNMMSGYTGTITQARSLTVGASGFLL